MDSSIMKINYINNKSNSLGIHYIELISDKVTYDNNIGKFVMSYLTPNLSKNEYDTQLPRQSASNVINRDQLSLGVSNITTSNYIELPIPKYLFYITNIAVSVYHPGGDESSTNQATVTINRMEYVRGQKFLVSNLAGNYDNPVIIGVI